jgi:hypothetical protein
MDKTISDTLIHHPLDDAKEGDVDAARHICEMILSQLRANKPLDQHSKKYLIEALQKIVDGIPANEAMLLKHKRGRQTVSLAVTFDVYSKIEKLHEKDGISYEDAYKVVAKQVCLDGKNRGFEMVRRIHKDGKQLLEKSDKEMNEWFKDYPPSEHDELDG